jgi:hypothetical protein
LRPGSPQANSMDAAMLRCPGLNQGASAVRIQLTALPESGPFGPGSPAVDLPESHLGARCSFSRPRSNERYSGICPHASLPRFVIFDRSGIDCDLLTLNVADSKERSLNSGSNDVAVSRYQPRRAKSLSHLHAAAAYYSPSRTQALTAPAERRSREAILAHASTSHRTAD